MPSREGSFQTRFKRKPRIRREPGLREYPYYSSGLNEISSPSGLKGLDVAASPADSELPQTR